MRRAVLLVLLFFLFSTVAYSQTYDGAGNLLTSSRLRDGSGFIVPVLDTSLTGRFPAGANPANGESNTVSISRIGAFNFIFNGSTWDRWTGAVSQGTPATASNGWPVYLTDGAYRLPVLDGTTFTGSNLILPGGALYTTSPPSIGNGTLGAFRMSSSRMLLTTVSDGTNTATVRDTGSNDSLNVAITDASGNQITSFGGGTEYTEDAPAAADPVGKASILVRADTPAGVTTTNGDNVAQRGTNYGAAYVQVVSSTGGLIDSFGGSGGTAQADRSAFTDGTTPMTPIGGVYNQTGTAPTEDQAAAVRITQSRAIHVNLRDETGTQILSSATNPNGGTSENALYTWNQANYQDDTAAGVATKAGIAVMGVATTDSVDAGDVGYVAMTTARGIEANLRDGSGAEMLGQKTMAGSIPVVLPSDQSIGGGQQYAEDTLHVSGDLSTMAGVVQLTADAAISGDGDRSLMQVDNNGFLKVRANAGTGNFTVVQGTGTNLHAVIDSGAITANQGSAASAAGRWPVGVTDGTNFMPTMDIASRSGWVKVTDGSGTLPAMNTASNRGYVQLTDGSFVQAFGNGTSTNAPRVTITNDSPGIFAQGTAGASTDYGRTVLAVRHDTATVDAGVIDGDRLLLSTDSLGRLRTTSADVTQPVSGTFWPTTAAAPLSSRLSDGTNFYDAAKTGQLPTALDGSGFLKVHEQGTAGMNLASVGGTSVSGANVVDAGNTAFRVNCVTGCTPGGSFSDDGAFTGGSTAVSPIAALYDTTPPAITDGSAGIPRMSSTRVLLVDGSGSTQPVSGPLTDTQLRATAVPVSGTFWQATQPVSGTVTANQGTANTAANRWPTYITDGTNTMPTGDTSARTIHTTADNAPFAVTGNGTATGAIRVSVASDSTGTVAVTQATASSLNARTDTSGATGAAPPARADFVGGLGSGATGGFVIGIPVCDSFANVNVSTATTTLLVTGVSGRHVRICSISLVTAGANNVALISGTGATCGTGTTGMNGGTTSASGWNFAANGGLTQGSGIGTINQTNATGDSVCVVTSAGTQLSGRIAYTIY